MDPMVAMSTCDEAKGPSSRLRTRLTTLALNAPQSPLLDVTATRRTFFSGLTVV